VAVVARSYLMSLAFGEARFVGIGFMAFGSPELNPAPFDFPFPYYYYPRKWPSQLAKPARHISEFSAILH
jgi:hypothetical protein